MTFLECVCPRQYKEMRGRISLALSYRISFESRLSALWIPHFLSDDHRFGGHLLSFTLEEGAVEIATCRQLQVQLPEGDAGFGQLDLARDRTQGLEKAGK